MESVEKQLSTVPGGVKGEGAREVEGDKSLTIAL